MPTNLNNRTHILFNTPFHSASPSPSHGWILMSRAAYSALRQIIGTATITYDSFYNFVDIQYANPSGDRYTFNNGHLIYLGITFQTRCTRDNFHDLLCDTIAPHWSITLLPGQSPAIRSDPRYFEYRQRRGGQRRRLVPLSYSESQVIIRVPPPTPTPGARSQS